MNRAFVKAISFVATAFLLLASICSLNCLAAPGAAASESPAEHSGCSTPASPETPQNAPEGSCSHHESGSFAMKASSALLDTHTIAFVAEPAAAASPRSAAQPLGYFATDSAPSRILPSVSRLPLRI